MSGGRRGGACAAARCAKQRSQAGRQQPRRGCYQLRARALACMQLRARPPRANAPRISSPCAVEPTKPSSSESAAMGEPAATQCTCTPQLSAQGQATQNTAGVRRQQAQCGNATWAVLGGSLRRAVAHLAVQPAGVRAAAGAAWRRWARCPLRRRRAALLPPRAPQGLPVPPPQAPSLLVQARPAQARLPALLRAAATPLPLRGPWLQGRPCWGRRAAACPALG